jgi:ribosomal protein S8
MAQPLCEIEKVLEMKYKKSEEKKITRKQAVKKMGFAAFTAATTMLLLNKPAKGQGGPGSPELPPDWY